MSVPAQWMKHITCRAGFALTFLLFIAGTGFAQSIAPFDRLSGHWSGSGTIELSSGVREPIKCRAAYDVLGDQRNLQLNIRCASASYNFDLRASANYAAGAISGSWSESTRNAAGTISGRAEGDRFQVVARASSFAASLTLITHGGHQSVSIRSQDAQSAIRGVSVSLRRS